MNEIESIGSETTPVTQSTLGGLAVRYWGTRHIQPLIIHWRVAVISCLLAFLYGSVIAGLLDDWLHNPDYSHGLFVPILSGYLIWRKREESRSVRKNPQMAGALVVVLSITLLFLGSLGAELFLTRVAIIGTLLGLIIYFAGFERLRVIAFPVVFLFFMIPLPVLVYNEIVFPLQLMASRIAIGVLDAINLFPVVREGNILILPHSRLEVIEACSGIRSLMSLVSLAVAYGYFVERNRWARLALVFVMVPMAVMSNGLRVMGTAILTYYWGATVADGFVHSFAGWAIFVIATLMFLAFHSAVARCRKMVWSDSSNG